MFLRIAFLVGFSLLIDLLNAWGLSKMLKRFKGSAIYSLFFKLYWGLGILLLLVFGGWFFYQGDPGLDYLKYRSYFQLFGIYILIYFPRIVLFAFVLVQWMYHGVLTLFFGRPSYSVRKRRTRGYYLTKTGLAFSVLAFIAVLHGMLIGKTHFVVKEVTLSSKQLPKEFDGFRIAQISDMHLGSFTDVEDVAKGLQLLMDQKPDMIVFTGDLVNNIAAEIDPYASILKSLEAPYGMYSILGNHDMGDYVKWKKAEMKFQHLNTLIKKQDSLGFKTLLNSHALVHKGADSIVIIGVENWGKPPFKKYGDLNRAMKGIENVPFKILLSHDPSHFTAEVLGKSDIQLTLSGHTHGMQLGWDAWGIKWSPAQWIYPLWNGMYRFQNQSIYVNPGFGYLAMPARIGIWPEITIITLKR